MNILPPLFQLESTGTKHLELGQGHSATCGGLAHGQWFKLLNSLQVKMPEKAWPLFFLELWKILRKTGTGLHLRVFQPSSPRLPLSLWLCQQLSSWDKYLVFFGKHQHTHTHLLLLISDVCAHRLLSYDQRKFSSGKTTPWASQDIRGYPSIGFVDWDDPGLAGIRCLDLHIPG